MAKGPIRGLETRHEHNDQVFLRDLRGPWARAVDFLADPASLGGTLVTAAVVGAMYPAVVDVLFAAGLGLFVWGMRRRVELPLRLPAQSGLPDPSDPHPAHGRPQPASGIFFMGNERGTGKQLFMSNDDLRRHILLAGTTGGGKSELLLSMVANALSWGSGFIYIDGKADRKLFGQICAMARRAGRDDDVLLVNFITGAKDLVGVRDARLRSNTLNPFAFGSSGMIIQMLVSLMSESSGDGQQWKDMAIAMMSCGIRALVFLRDKGEIVLSVKVIREYLTLDKYLELYHRQDLPESVRGDLKAFLVGLPGLSEDVLEIPLEQLRVAKMMPKQAGVSVPEISAKTYEQFGYRAMQFSRLLDSLASDYGHIFNTPLGDVDFWDVVVNRRILVVLLPALEKSSTELANLGKVVVANLKAMMAMAMGDEIEGSWADLVDKRVTAAPSPILTIFDESGYYIVDGMAVMAAQARSLGFGLVFGTQDIPALHRLAEKEPDSIIANCNTKIAMKVEDPGKTWELFQRTAGEALVTRADAFDGEMGTVTGKTYRDGNRAQVTSTNRISLRDLQEQGAGEFHLLSEGKLVRGKAFHAAPERSVDLKELHIGPHHLIKVAPPAPVALDGAAAVSSLADKLIDPKFVDRVAQETKNREADGVIADVVRVMRGAVGAGVGPAESACVGIASLVAAKRRRDEALMVAAEARRKEANEVRQEKAADPIGEVLETWTGEEPEPAFDGGALRLTDMNAETFEAALEGQAKDEARPPPAAPEGARTATPEAGDVDELSMLEGLLDDARQEEAQQTATVKEEASENALVQHGITFDGTFFEMSRAVSGNATMAMALARLGVGDAEATEEAVSEPDGAGQEREQHGPEEPAHGVPADVVDEVLGRLYAD